MKHWSGSHSSGSQFMNDYVLDHLPTTPMDILSFWFSDKSRPKWFAKDPSFDAVVSARYGAVVQAAKRGELFQWRETIRGRLAEIIVLDQFSRNIYRVLLQRSRVTRRRWCWHKKLPATRPDSN